MSVNTNGATLVPPVSFSSTSTTFSAQFDKNPEGSGGGKNGATFIPSVSPDGTLSWTNDQGLTNPAPVNIKGEPGEPGAPGEPGEPGYTPVKGTDYNTEADKTEMVAAVIAALPVYDGEAVNV